MTNLFYILLFDEDWQYNDEARPLIHIVGIYSTRKLAEAEIRRHNQETGIGTQAFRIERVTLDVQGDLS